MTETRSPHGEEQLAQVLAVPVADSHCHLDMCAADGGPDPAQLLAAAHEAGVVKVIQVGCDVAGSQWAADLAAEQPDVWAAVALHPNEAPRIHDAGGLDAIEAAWGQIAALATLPQVRAIGETGMDFFRTPPHGRAIQEESFRKHIEIAKHSGKPLVVHDRESHADVLRILDDEGSPDDVVLHCFSGDAEFAQAAVQRGWYCSFSGVVTFKNAHQLREALSVVPAELLLVETDAPFLTPMPHRGKPNSPALIPLTVGAMGQVRGVAPESLCAQIMTNTERVFGPL